MRYSSIVRAVGLAAFLGGASLAFALSTGPEPARTGAWKVQNKTAEPTCTNCHTANSLGIPPAINDPSGGLRILDVPAKYEPDHVYTLRVHLEHAWDPMPPDPLRWGFQMQAVQASTGDSAGTWILPPNAPPDTFKIMKPSGTSIWKNRRYVEHTRNPLVPDAPGGATHLGELGPIEWHVNWQAPPGDSGKIYFFAAGNSANGDGVSIQSGDFIFTTAESTIGLTNVDVPSHPAALQLRTGLEPPYPNPMTKCTGISFTIARGGVVDISVYDLQGRKVRTALHEFREAGTHGAYWDGRGVDGRILKNGVYLVRMSAPDGKRSAQKVVLAR